MLNRFRFVRVESPKIDAEIAETAETLSNIDDIIANSRAIGKYVFAENAALTEKLRKAKSVEIVKKISDAGIVSYRAVLTLADGMELPFVRLYGNGRGNAYPTGKWSADAVKKAVYGFCTSDGEQVTELRTNGQGKPVNVPVIYLQVAAE